MMKVLERPARGSIEIILIAIISLILFIISQQSRRFSTAIALVRDQVHAERADYLSKSETIKGMHASTPTHSTSSIRCRSNAAQSGGITQQISLCVVDPPLLDKFAQIIDMSELFANAFACPKRDGATLLPTSLSAFSRYECSIASGEHASPLILKGDAVGPTPVELKSDGNSALLAVSGSLWLPTLYLNSETYVISLGDIEIVSIDARNNRTLRLFLFAPLGTIRVSHIASSILVSSHSEKEFLPVLNNRQPWPASVALPVLSLIPLGFFPQTFGITP